MSDLRQRKPVQEDIAIQHHEEEEDDDYKPHYQQDPPDMRPDLGVVITLLLILMTFFTTWWYYRVDLNSKGPFSTFVNDRILGYNPYPKEEPPLVPL